MSGIPEDVMQTARDAFSSWQTNTGPGAVAEQHSRSFASNISFIDA